MPRDRTEWYFADDIATALGAADAAYQEREALEVELDNLVAESVRAEEEMSNMWGLQLHG